MPNSRPRILWGALLAGGALLLGCKAEVHGFGGTGPGAPPPASAPTSGVRRLTANEYDNTLHDLFQDTSNSGFAMLPQDPADPFDNNYQLQNASAALIQSVETLATNAATRALANPAVHQTLIPCTPTAPDDAACMRTVITTAGRRILRRPLAEDEITGFLSLQTLAKQANSFDTGVKLFLQAVLQSPEFLYRVEVGTPVPGTPGLFRLNDYEIATRLSYLLWGSTPPDWLLDLAASNALESSQQLTAAATKLLADPRAKLRVERFHALWLSYYQLPHSADLNTAMETESAALVDRVAFDSKADYFQLFLSPETYINDALATQYGLPATGAPGYQWVKYGTSGRQGILSHGSVLSVGAKFADTSPTQRGRFVRNRLLCQEIPAAPADVNVDTPPTSPTSNCKKDRYMSHANVGSCASCHAMMDPIGFGLENYDQNGKFRTTDVGQPNCPISGDGSVQGLGTFNGPAALENLLVGSGQLEQCVVKQLFRFSSGRREADADAALLARLTAGFKKENRSFQQLLLDVVADPSFAYRMDE